MLDPSMELLEEGRKPQPLLREFTYKSGDLVGLDYMTMAIKIHESIPDGPDQDEALQKLLESKNAVMRSLGANVLY